MTVCLLCGYVGTYEIYYSEQTLSDDICTFLQCPSCSFVFLKDPIKTESIASYYHLSWESRESNKLFKEKSYRSAQTILERLERYVRPGNFLDVGAGPGYYMQVASERGWKAFGVDPAANEVSLKGNSNLRCSTLEEARFESEFFDACLVNHTLAHLSDLYGTLLEIKRVLKPRGVLFGATPNFTRLGKKRIHTEVEELIRGRHLYVFSPKTIKRILEKAHFEPFLIETSQTIVMGSKVETLEKKIRIPIRKCFQGPLRRPKELVRSYVGKFVQGPMINFFARKQNT